MINLTMHKAVERYLQPLATNPVFAELWESDQGFDVALGRRLCPNWISMSILLVEHDERPSRGEKAVLAFALWLHGYRVSTDSGDSKLDWFWTMVDVGWRQRMAELFTTVVTS